MSSKKLINTLSVGDKVIFHQVGFNAIIKVSKVNKKTLSLENGLKFDLETGVYIGEQIGFYITNPTPAQLDYQLTMEAMKRISIDVNRVDFLAYSPRTILEIAEKLNLKSDAVDFLKNKRDDAKEEECFI